LRQCRTETEPKRARIPWGRSIERLFEDGKSELGLDHFEARKYLCVRRHLIVSCVSYQFLAEFHAKHRGEKSRPDDLPASRGHGAAGADLVDEWSMFATVGRIDRRVVGADTASQRQGQSIPSKTNDWPIARD
jgi:hypothetical protein